MKAFPGVILPQAALDLLGIREGDTVYLVVVDGIQGIYLTPHATAGHGTTVEPTIPRR
jgi:antitoxin component of MazEF toxin-antitoxin module